MGLKKYEIITVGSNKRVRALRSWQVGDRYVNIGDVGGTVYDEKTLSQDGACWLFRGNFGFPGARIGGDSIVDVGETTLSAAGAPNVDILGSSVVVGSRLRFESRPTADDAVVLTAADFEQGGFNYVAGANWETWKTGTLSNVRLKAPIFMGGASKTIKLSVPGYTVQAYVLDRDGIGITVTAPTGTGEGVTLAIPAGQYFTLRLAKDPTEGIVPADAAAAQITFTGTYETKLSIVDSRVEINPATSGGILALQPGGTYTVASGVKYPDSVMQNSKVSMMVSATDNRLITLMAEFINASAVIDASVETTPAFIGIYKNVKNLAFSGSIAGETSITERGLIRATDCDNFAVSPTIFPGLAKARLANMPFIFQGCNVPNGLFYHHAQIANTYQGVNFDLATRDLGKAIGRDTGKILASSEVNGMYRGYGMTLNIFGPLIETAASVERSALTINEDSRATTIYADAYLNGTFYFRGTNVFGNSMKHEASNTQNVRVVQGGFTLTAGQPPVPNVDATRVRTEGSFRINGANGISVQNVPAGLETRIVYLDGAGRYVALGSWYTEGTIVPNAQLINTYAYLLFRKTEDAAITPADLAGVTVTTYNGCRIINTKAAAAVIAGNVRVEDNATLIDVSVTGTGYFGGNSIIQAPSALKGQLPIAGAAYMSDNAVFAPSEANASAGLSLLDMRDNSVFAGRLGSAVKYNITMADNAGFFGSHDSGNAWVLKGNSYVAPAAVANSLCEGMCIMKDNARIENGSLTTIGHITFCGKYKQTATKTWTGKRVIASQDAPTYDDNVKTKYDI